MSFSKSIEKMNRYGGLLSFFLLASLSNSAAANGYLGSAPETLPPLGVIQAGTPLVQLVSSKDHKLFYEAYNDVSDIDGDGQLDIRFDPDITYFGLFDSTLCYTHNGLNTNSGLFSPAAQAGSRGTCTNQWSGNWLNYVTTSRMDALRKVLYGGHRDVDTTTSTVLRRAYIPQDTHSWAKEYTSPTIDGYEISAYTPLSSPATGRRHFFGNVTMVSGVRCDTLDNCSNLPPWLSVVENSNLRVWQWASSESPVLAGGHGGTRRDFTVRVEVCKDGFIGGCKMYGTATSPIYKPVGLLHEFGENNAMHFGLTTGSYNRNMSGGVVRQIVTSFQNEVNSSGIFTNIPNGIVTNFNRVRIRDWNNTVNDRYRTASFRTGPMAEGSFVDWGNPIAEMMYESVRYMAGMTSPSSSFDTQGSHDAEVGLSRVATWDVPFRPDGGAVWCAKPNLLVLSDSYPSYDADGIPGSAFAATGLANDLPGFNGKALLDNISIHEPNVTGTKFVGQSTATNFDFAPTPKAVTSLAEVRGLAPEEPTKQGSYYSAAVAHYAKTIGFFVNDNNGNPQRKSIDSYFVTFPSPNPVMEIPLNGSTIRVIPFAKTIDGGGVNRTKGQFQPTNPIVDVYVLDIKNIGSLPVDVNTNGGRPYIRYKVIFEADEQGNDFDMDVDSVYTLSVTNSGQLRIEVQVIYESTGSNQNIGYVISGTNRDGLYLVASDKLESLPYFLNTPPGRNPGYCDPVPVAGNPRFNECRQLPWGNETANGGPGFDRSVELFTASATPSATFLRDPLWYAAKWGGFIDRNGNARPDLTSEWDSDGDGVPDTYFLVQNPLKLREALSRAFRSIFERSSAAGNIAANSTSLTTESSIFQSIFNSASWSGDLLSFPIGQTGVAAAPAWRASNRLPAPSSRRIFANDGVNTVPFTATGLSSSQFSSLGGSVGALSLSAEDVIAYIRGERSKELQNGGQLRNRSTSVIGDIVHSSPVYVKENNTVFVGSNGGMLHGFNATTGVEQFAFVPGSFVSQMRQLAVPGYETSHRYFVDGEIVVSSRTQTTGKNVLVAFLGRGGKGFFALDVTDPAGFGNSGSSSRYLGAVGASDNDMGHLLGRPVIAKVRSGSGERNVVIFGNGYNSVNNRAVLYIYDLDTLGLVSKIDTGVGGSSNPNGLSSPGVLLNAEGLVDSVYAGDALGNVWKFDLTSSNPNSWRSAYGTTSAPSPMFRALDGSNNPQPITAPVHVARNNDPTSASFGRVFVFVGTGSYMAAGDPSSTSVQSLYGLIDDGASISGRSVLRQRTIDQIGTFAGRKVRTFGISTAGDMTGRRGWFLDLVTPVSSTSVLREGERVVSSPRVIGTLRPTLIFSSVIPVVDPCVPGGKGFVNAIDPFTGASLFQTTDTVGIFDLNNNNFDDDKLNGVFIASFDLNVGLPSEPVLVGNRLVVGGSLAEIDDVRVNTPGGPAGASVRGRISWREVIR